MRRLRRGRDLMKSKKGGKDLKQLVREMLEKTVDTREGGNAEESTCAEEMTNCEVIAKNLVSEAVGGNTAAAKYIVGIVEEQEIKKQSGAEKFVLEIKRVDEKDN